MPRTYRSLEERLIANSVQSAEHSYNGQPCWEWIGTCTTNRNGTKYPRINLRYQRGPRKGKVRTVYAHRLSLVVFKGRRLTPRMVARHLCNNTICIHPEHLVGGTQASNVRQCVRDGRHKTPWRKAA